MTRGLIMMLRGNFISGFLLNPNALIPFVLLFVYPLIIIIGIILRKDLLFEMLTYFLKICKRRSFIIPFFAIELLIWIHNMVIGL
ncbi:hypothetical protein ACFO3G_07160 [Falsiporphyromonas endometrii]|uniref:Uncharacterized protein n=2 Tax=Falsiporphyromonas endometrii TaxID=1387297 RepID=A0ABV9K850_9PORP